MSIKAHIDYSYVHKIFNSSGIIILIDQKLHIKLNSKAGDSQTTITLK